MSKLTMALILAFAFYTYIHVKYPKECASALQSMREESHPELYILKELRKQND